MHSAIQIQNFNFDGPSESYRGSSRDLTPDSFMSAYIPIGKDTSGQISAVSPSKTPIHEGCTYKKYRSSANSQHSTGKAWKDGYERSRHFVSPGSINPYRKACLIASAALYCIRNRLQVEHRNHSGSYYPTQTSTLFPFRLNHREPYRIDFDLVCEAHLQQSDVP